MKKYSNLTIITGIFLILLCCTSCNKNSNLPPAPPPPPPPAVSNRPPVAVAGPDRTLPIILNSVFLGGQATDPDGNADIVAYSWNKISGPTSFTFLSAFPLPGPTTTVKDLEIGEYQFEFTVTDRGGLIARDTVKVTIDNRTGNVIHNLPWAIVFGQCGFIITDINTYLPPTGSYEVYLTPKYNGVLLGWGLVKPFTMAGPQDAYYQIENGNMLITVPFIDCGFDDADSHSVGIVFQ